MINFHQQTSRQPSLAINLFFIIAVVVVVVVVISKICCYFNNFQNCLFRGEESLDLGFFYVGSYLAQMSECFKNQLRINACLVPCIQVFCSHSKQLPLNSNLVRLSLLFLFEKSSVASGFFTLLLICKKQRLHLSSRRLLHPKGFCGWKDQRVC